MIGRLAEGRSIAEATAEVKVIGGNLAAGLLDLIVGGARTQLLFLFGAVVCVLLVTCANTRHPPRAQLSSPTIRPNR